MELCDIMLRELLHQSLSVRKNYVLAVLKPIGFLVEILFQVVRELITDSFALFCLTTIGREISIGFF